MVKHGLSIGMERIDDTFFLTLKVVGKLTHEDYMKITPIIDAALEGVKDPKINALVDIESLEGWDLRAAWDDFKIGLKHGGYFEKVAIYGDQKWIEYGVKISSWFMSAKVKQFQAMDEAIAWINTKEPILDVVQKELFDREEDIRDSLEDLFKKNMKITDWNIPEANDQEASEILVDILSKKLDEIKLDVKNGKYKYF
ncbi:MAG: STAS/SEC14 domain-containing protein [Campylobacterota bacterium]|nr:STAS/SEC14 domain-containing protein [Campylobacterota bacterium]